MTGHQWLHVHPDWFLSTGDPRGAGSGLVSHLSTVPRTTEWVLLSDDQTTVSSSCHPQNSGTSEIYLQKDQCLLKINVIDPIFSPTSNTQKNL